MMRIINLVYYVGDLQNAILNQQSKNSGLFREHIEASFTYIPIIKNLEIEKQQLKEKLLNIPLDKTKKCKE